MNLVVQEPDILILFYSIYGTTYQIAKEAKKAVKNIGGNPKLMRVEESPAKKYLDENGIKVSKLMKNVPIANPTKDLKGIDGLILVTPIQDGIMCSQMRNFWDQTIKDGEKELLCDKPAFIFTNSITENGSKEYTNLSAMHPLLDHGMLILGLPYSNKEKIRMERTVGKSSNESSSLPEIIEEHAPSENELWLIRQNAERLTKIAVKLIVP